MGTAQELTLSSRFHRSSYAIGLKEKIKNETLLEGQGLSVADYATPWRFIHWRFAGLG